MLKIRGGLLVLLPLASLAAVQPADAAILGPDAASCVSGNGPAVLVRVTGLKNRQGMVRARTFGSNRSTWFDKRSYLKRTEVRVPASGPVEICMPVPKSGTYVVDIRHDTNNNGDTDRSDGAGASGNPKITLLDILLGRKPPASKVAFQVDQGVTPITIVVNYASGGSFKPAQMTSR